MHIIQKYFLPIFLAAFTAFIVLLGGLLGGVSFGKILQRILLFSILMAFLGFILIYVFERWGIDITGSEESNNMDNEQKVDIEESKEAIAKEINTNESDKAELTSKVEEETKGVEEDSGASEDSFTYTVDDDEEIEFKPLDETIIEEPNSKEVVVNGEKFECDPKKAAAAIRQLLAEDEENE